MMKSPLLFLILLFSTIGASGDTYHVSRSGSHTPPFNSEASAATNIQSAVDLATAGDTVVISGERYELSQQITIDSEIEIKAAAGQQVIIDGQGATRCFLLSDVPCVLNGLTIINGFVSGSDEGGGVFCSGNTAVLTNCVISDCEAESGGGVAGTTAYFCEISGNRARFGGGGERAILHSCVVAYNTALEDGGGLDFSTAYSSLIHSNTVTTASGFGGGGVSLDSMLVNCTVVNNHSAGDAGGMEGGFSANSIVINNTAAGTGMNFNGSVTFTNSCCPDLVAGSGENITDLPLFVDAPAYNYRIQAASPCRNTGENGYAASNFDLDGNPRIVEGAVDMGAYELQITPEDMDGDGMLDTWEVRYFGHITNGIPNAHDDADNYYNLHEFIAGTDPTNSASYFAVTNWASASFTLEWPVATNRLYSVFWSTNLISGFSVLTNGLEYPVNSFTDTMHTVEDEGFYQVEVRLK